MDYYITPPQEPCVAGKSFVMPMDPRQALVVAYITWAYTILILMFIVGWSWILAIKIASWHGHSDSNRQTSSTDSKEDTPNTASLQQGKKAQWIQSLDTD
ncbi:hypothetical protein B9Z19DRAFT_1129968 [Tuber borchii]|uniref:Uncharacterized protein n=1 Tax=Tuber borchii TaxID=42251 RepID=A0A2T6ZLF6_TUBBO|nr:hypothetical protein B9Z19DRAFT_1129968 [Tuber borchii]